jgi:hypothetical protein
VRDQVSHPYPFKTTGKMMVLFILILVQSFLCFNRAPRHEGSLGSGGISQRILYLSTRWRWVVRFTARPLNP